MRILVTRPQGDAEETAARLAALGHQAIVAPLLDIVFASGPEIALDNVQAVLVTSANSIRALAARTAHRAVRIVAVGAQSSAAARALGYAFVESADGDADALVARVTATLTPKNGTLFLPAGKDTRGNVAGRLRDKGFQLRSEVLYEAVAAKALPDSAREALSNHMLDAALFYSPRTAGTFSTLVVQAGLENACAGVIALCISRATADALLPLTFRDVRVAERPNEESLFGLI